METDLQRTIKELTFDDLRQITNDFSDKMLLGCGSQGKVFKGVLKDGVVVAVKLLHQTTGSCDEAVFKNEFLNLSRISHPNIVRILGYCYEIRHKHLEYNGELVFARMEERALCFEYIPNGSLRHHLSDEQIGFEWETRYKIIKGICEGLQFLHEGLQAPIYHLNLTPDNILLDDSMVPKIADFGLSRLIDNCDMDDEDDKISGTLGYMPPEYIQAGLISKKFDVFSFGVTVLKIITGDAGYYSSFAELSTEECIDLVHENWRKRLQMSSVYGDELLDQYCLQVRRCTEIALHCVEADRHRRPTMSDVVHMLNETETTIMHRVKNPLSSMRQDMVGAEVGEPTFQLLKAATENFAVLLAGQGSFGAVYKGKLNGKDIAVKKLNDKSIKSEQLFRSEVDLIMKLEHKNIVRLKGYCYETREEAVFSKEEQQQYICEEVTERLLCYEFLQNGSLDILLNDERNSLNWKTRYTIMQGICEGLHYLHEGRKDNPIVHMNLKPANILLGDGMVPKLGDLGLFANKQASIVASTAVESRRYLAPDYVDTGKITTKSDVYSLGVIIIEIVTGEKCPSTDASSVHAYNENVKKNWMQNSYITSKYPSLEAGFVQQVKCWISIGLKCMDKMPERRPTTGHIIHFLETESASFMDTFDGKLKKMSFRELKDITNNFSQKTQLEGKSVFGAVYKGTRLDEEPIIISRLEEKMKLPESHFKSGVDVNLVAVKHKNILQLKGYSDEIVEVEVYSKKQQKLVPAEVRERLFCFEAVLHGSLDGILYDKTYKLDWEPRYRIINGICEGLRHLHEECENAPIIHVDLKPSNVFLSYDMVPKITNLGLSSLIAPEQTHIFCTTDQGSIQYMAPEYRSGNGVTTKSDIYSLGILMLEIVTKQKCPCMTTDISVGSFISDVRQSWMKASHIKSKYPGIEDGCLQQLKRCVRVALECVQIKSEGRPSVGEVIRMLQTNSDHSEDIIDVKVMKMSFQELEGVTDKFSRPLRCEDGSSAAVYEGMLGDGKAIAVKRLQPIAASAAAREKPVILENQFKSELNLMRMEHKNIIQLIGYCDDIIEVPVFSKKQHKLVYEDVAERLLCFEFLPKGSLDKILYDKSRTLEWQARYLIIHGICEGLHYLHEGCQDAPIVHMDLKPANVLLDEVMHPKLAFFGQSKVLSKEGTLVSEFPVTDSHLRGYLAPENVNGSKVTLKSDIYSLGILIFEIVTGENCPSSDVDISARSFVKHVRKTWTKDSHIASKYASIQAVGVQEVKSCIRLALECVQVEPDKRPTTGQLISILESRCTNSVMPATKLDSCFGICK